MSRSLLLAAGAAALLALPPVAPASAQTSPSAMDLIQQLRPQGGQTRGIRMPAAEPPTAAPGAPAPAAAQAPAPMPGGSGSPSRSIAGAAAPRAPAGTQAAAATTAPAGVSAVSMTVNFPTGSATLTPAAERALAPLGQALSSPELSAYRFRIEGHTDTVGDRAENQALSERRAAAVRDYVVNRFRVDPTRLEAVGLGEDQPLVRTADQVPEGRNRRVQVLNIGG